LAPTYRTKVDVCTKGVRIAPQILPKKLAQLLLKNKQA
jgi:hypothetical protein